MVHCKDDCNKVLLLHGIWMCGIEMGLLRRRLQQAGYDVSTFRYPSLRRTPLQNARRLNMFILERGFSCLHLVAHSLGGLVVLDLFQAFPQQPPGRVVLLGSPVRGSAVARQLASRRWGRSMIGRAGDSGLLDGAPTWSGGRDLGTIAGTSGMGVGRLLGGLDGVSDGTVMVSETVIENATDSCHHPVGHMGLLASRPVAQDVCRFLRSGRFSD